MKSGDSAIEREINEGIPRHGRIRHSQFGQASVGWRAL
jgi:hypothetical protein